MRWKEKRVKEGQRQTDRRRVNPPLLPLKMEEETIIEATKFVIICYGRNRKQKSFVK